MPIRWTGPLACALCLLAGATAQTPEVLSGADHLRVVRGELLGALSADDFELKRSGQSVLIAAQGQIADLSSGRQAGAREWSNGRCVALDRGPEWPGAILKAPADSSDLAIAGRQFSKSGPVWLGYLFATNGSYLALFSTSARRLHRPDQSWWWAGSSGDLESSGEVFVDLYRVADAQRLATAKFRFSGAPGVEHAFWVESRVLVVPAPSGAALVGLLERLPAETSMPTSQGAAAWSCRTPPPAPRILGLRDEGVDEDRNGLLDAVRVIAKIDTALPGPYRFTFRMQDAQGNAIESEGRQNLAAGIQKIAVSFPGEAWQSESYRLASIRFTTDRGPRVPPVDAVPARALRTRIWARSRFEQPGPRYEAGTAKVAGVDYNRDGLYDGLEVELVYHSVREGSCTLSAVLSHNPTQNGLLDMATWNGDVRRGPNAIRFRFDSRSWVKKLAPQPFYLTGTQPECGNDAFSGPTSPAIKLPPIDFSRFKDAHCFLDLNDDGVVDEADLKMMLTPLEAASPNYRASEGYKNLLNLYESARGCRTR